MSDFWISQLMLDDGKWDGFLAPTHIVAKDNELIPVYIGRDINNEFPDAIAIYVKTIDWYSIDHESCYIFIHDPCIADNGIDEELTVMINEHRKGDKDTHSHITKNMENADFRDIIGTA